ncbi:hypothetical protein MYXO_02489 [Myxococcaceae bacterium]|nr:hypothetical protein MYXO_02489 [Myxococcaceae bacterium]
MLAGVLLAGCGEPQPPPQRPAPAADASRGEDAVGKPRLGLWIPCEGSERALDDPERVRRLLDGATELGVSDLFVQVYRGGRSWYAAQLADDSPHRALDGADPLGDLVRGAHARGLRVHAWVNVLTLGTHRDGPLLRAVGRDAVQVDRRGRSLLDYPELQVPADEQRFARVGTPGVWLDPATPALAERLGAVFAELLVRVPDLDGLHLDYVRYPDVLPFVPGARFDVGLDFGFGAPSRTRFRAETGLDAPFADDSRNAEAFDAWRREKLGDVVGEISRAARRARPGLVVSAAVWAFPTRAYLSLHQDWTHWLESGHLDFAVAMAYSRDPRLFTMMARSNVAIGGSRTWLGLGAWLFESAPERAVAQLREARALAPGGVVLFSWDALVASPELRGALAAERVP